MALVYTNAGSVNYAVYNLSTAALHTEKIGNGREATLTLDSSGQLHIAYIDNKNDLIYQVYNGLGWNPTQTIDSLKDGGIDGHLSSPMLLIDDNNRTSLIYFDSAGGRSENNSYTSNDSPDLVLAVYNDKSWEKTVISYGESYADNTSKILMPPAYIVAKNNCFYIGVAERIFDGSKYLYTYNLYNSSNNTLPLSYPVLEGEKNDSYFRLFAVENTQDGTYSLYKKGDILYLLKDDGEEIYLKDRFSADGADLVQDENKNIRAAAIQSNRLLYWNNGLLEETELPNAISYIHKRVVTLYKDNTQYVLYTDKNGKINIVSKEFEKDQPPSISPIPPLSSECSLLSLDLSSVILNPSFSPDIFNYTTEISPSTAELKITTTSAEKAKVFINGEEANSKILSLDEDKKEILIEVLAEDNISQNIYTVHLIKKDPQEEEQQLEEEQEEENPPPPSPVLKPAPPSKTGHLAGIAISKEKKIPVAFTVEDKTAVLTIPEGEQTISLQLFSSFWEAISKRNIQKIVIKTKEASFVFDQEALSELNSLVLSNKDDFIIRIHLFKTGISSALYFESELTGKDISLSDSKIEIQIPYKPLFKEDNITVLNLKKGIGNVYKLKADYKPLNNTLSFKTSNPGLFIISSKTTFFKNIFQSSLLPQISSSFFLQNKIY